jgi:single-stranded DNA-binding protein
MNQVQLVGVLIWPVELRRDASTGQTIGKAMLAVPGGSQSLNFIPVTLHGREATDAAKYLGEGSRVSVTGNLHSVLVTERDGHGNKRTRRVLSVVAERVCYLVIREPRAGEPS